MGLASGVYLTAANTLVSELFPERPGRALGQHGVAAQLAAVGAPALISFVLVVGTWRTALQGIAVAAGVVTVAFTIIARRAQLPDAGAPTATSSARRAPSGGSSSPASLPSASRDWSGTGCSTSMSHRHERRPVRGVGSDAPVARVRCRRAGLLRRGRLADRLPSIPYLLACWRLSGCVLVLPYATRPRGRWPSSRCRRLRHPQPLPGAGRVPARLAPGPSPRERLRRVRRGDDGDAGRRECACRTAT